MEPKMIEEEPKFTPTIVELGNAGYGVGTISAENEAIPTEPKEAAYEIIKSGECLVPVRAKHGDGCIDGRPGGESDIPNVAGGGYVTELAAVLGISGEQRVPVEELLKRLGEVITDAGLFCGAHTADHHGPGGTGCGANDNFVKILQNASLLKAELRGSIEAIFGVVGLPFNEAIFDAVMSNWRSAAEDQVLFGESNGESRLDAIVDLQAEANESAGEFLAETVELRGEHNEVAIVLNFIEGTTFDQTALRQKLTEEYPAVDAGALPQVFVVDVWRVVELAQVAGLDDEAREAALYAAVLYQLATAATLTDGSQKIFAYTNN